jgi:hypothetical protein
MIDDGCKCATRVLASMPKTEAELLFFEESGGYEFLLRSMKEPYDPDC